MTAATIDPAGMETLAREADAVAVGAAQAVAAPGAAAPGVPATIDTAAGNSAAVAFALAMARELSGVLWSPPLRTLQERMPDEVIERIAGPWGRATAAAGFDLQRFTGGPWAEAIITTGPLLWAIAKALLAELRERNRAPAREVVTADDPGRPE